MISFPGLLRGRAKPAGRQGSACRVEGARSLHSPSNPHFPPPPPPQHLSCVSSAQTQTPSTWLGAATGSGLGWAPPKGPCASRGQRGFRSVAKMAQGNDSPADSVPSKETRTPDFLGLVPLGVHSSQRPHWTGWRHDVAQLDKGLFAKNIGQGVSGIS